MPVIWRSIALSIRSQEVFAVHGENRGVDRSVFQLKRNRRARPRDSAGLARQGDWIDRHRQRSGWRRCGCRCGRGCRRRGGCRRRVGVGVGVGVGAVAVSGRCWRRCGCRRRCRSRCWCRSRCGNGRRCWRTLHCRDRGSGDHERNTSSAARIRRYNDTHCCIAAPGVGRNRGERHLALCGPCAGRVRTHGDRQFASLCLNGLRAWRDVIAARSCLLSDGHVPIADIDPASTGPTGSAFDETR